jgi:hypothetical protein
MVFLITLLKQKVLIPYEISIKTNIHSSYFIYFSHSKILGCDRLPPLKEISSPRFGEARKKDGFGILSGSRSGVHSRHIFGYDLTLGHLLYHM